MQSIKNIIFDFGGVIYDIDYFKSVEEFNKLGAIDFEAMYSQANQIKLFEQLEVGELTNEEFRAELKLNLDPNTCTNEIDDAWNALLIGFKKSRLDLLIRLSKNYNIYLLSNSNAIHYKIFFEEFQNITKLRSFDDLFIKAYFSFDIKLRKPDLKAFQYVIDKQQLSPSDTLFIDDSIQNIEPAQAVGLKTYFLRKGEDLMDLFSENHLRANLKID